MRKRSAFVILMVIVVCAASGVAVFLKGGRVTAKQTTYNTPKNIPNVTILIVYDNNPYKDGLATAWGFSCVIRGLEKTILFDTGGDGSILLTNMRKLGIDPGEIDLVVLSHIHADHVGGLHSFLLKNHEVTVYLPKSFPGKFKDSVKKCGAKIVEVRKPLRICEQVYSTGELGTWIKEQSLIIHTDKGLVVITGCAHPGIVEIVKKAKDLVKDEVLLVMGGFHLVGESTDKIEKSVSGFKKLGVRYVGPCHCSGDTARRLFKKKYSEDFVNVGAGRLITMEDLR
ncbi:MAG: MBL fold metallo-hydrolase [Proteobacteria bacterium]|nr:MBL fold metallo-hydrolase [Pseudomonadota bacterium]